MARMTRPNYRTTADAGIPLLFHIEPPWSRAAECGCWASSHTLMKTSVLCIFLVAVYLIAAEPKFLFENRPESGIPPDAERQQENATAEQKQTTLRGLTEGLDSVRVRYYSAEWTSDEQVKTYLRGLLADPTIEAQSRQMWSQVVLEPEIECQLTFNKIAHGRLLLWKSVGCIQDGGRWWFISFGDYYRQYHPKAKK